MSDSTDRDSTVFLVGAVLLLVVAGGAALFFWQSVRVQRMRMEAEMAQREALEARELADRQRQQAEDNFHRARAAVDALITQAGENPEAKDPSAGPRREELLHSALAYYRELLEQEGAGKQGELAEVALRLAQTLQKAGNPDEANRSVRHALEVLEKRLPTKPDDLYQLARLQALAGALAERGKKEPTAAEKSERRRVEDQALESLRRAVAAGFGDVQRLKTAAEFEPLRSRANFQKLVKPLELPRRDSK